jgi:hypothetical protein
MRNQGGASGPHIAEIDEEGSNNDQNGDDDQDDEEEEEEEDDGQGMNMQQQLQ